MTQEQFIKQISELNIHLTKLQLEQLEQFYQLLITWNQKMNLTRITSKEDCYLKHFFDSLTLVTVVDFNKIETLCDIGTGAGFPGIVLKIAFPHLKITLVDKLRKRVNYLNEIIRCLNLKDIVAIHTRAEEFNQTEQFDLVTARAVANLSLLCSYCLSPVKINGHFVAMKGHVEEELKQKEELEKQYHCQFEKVVEFQLPYENSVRNLVFIKKLGKIPKTNKKIVRK